MLEALQAQLKQMKPATTKVKGAAGVRAVRSDAHHVLVVSRKWKTVYEWLQDDIAVVLFTSKETRSGVYRSAVPCC